MADLANGYQIGQSRVFLQANGSAPDADVEYMGCLNLGDSELPLGDLTPVYCPSSEKSNTWVVVDTITSAPGLPTVDGTQRLDRYLRDAWLGIAERGCTFNLQEKIFCNGRPDDYNAWDGKWLLFGARMTAVTIPMSSPLSGDDNAAADLTFSITYRSRTRLLKLLFGAKAEALVVSEVLDGFFYDVISCGECGSLPSDGCQRQYWLAAASGGSPGLSSRIIFTLNNWQTSDEIDIFPLAAQDGRRIAPMGQYLIGVSPAANGLFYSTFDDINAGVVNFTLTTTGYTTDPRALYVKSPSECFIAGAGGYIYFLDEPTGTPVTLVDGSLTVQDFNDIHGSGNTIVAVGQSNAVIYSTNNGQTWASVTGPVVGVGLNAVWVLSTNVWWVGANDGTLWWTRDYGATWTQKGLTAGLTSITDISFADSEGNVGYVAASTTTAGRIYSTHDAGRSWQLAGSTDNRLQSVPTALRYNVVKPCGYNVVGIGGAKTAGGDGVIAIAQ